MLTIFNRRELMTIPSQKKFFRIRETLAAAGIPSAVKTRGAARAAESARHGTPGLWQDALYTYTIYVHKDDYDRALAAVRSGSV